MKSLAENPYNFFPISPELASGEKFVEHYAIAFDIAQNIDISRPKELAGEIRSNVTEVLGENTPLLEVIAVSALTAQARDRALRRPIVRCQKEIRQEERKLWPPISVGSIKRRRELMKEQIMSYIEQAECSKAQISWVREAADLRSDIFSPKAHTKA